MVLESSDVLKLLDIQPIRPYNKKIRATEKAQNKEQLIPSTPRVLKYSIIEGINCIRLLICRRIVVTWKTFSFQVLYKPRSSVESRFGSFDRDFNSPPVTAFMTVLDV